MKTIRELLTGHKPLALKATTTALQAARAMRDAHVGAVLVIGEHAELLGIFTERDLMVRVVVTGADPAQVPIGTVMTSDLFVAPPDRKVNDMAREMQARHIRHLPVVEGERVLGLLSLRDLLREHLEIKRTEVRALHAYIQGEEQAPGQ